MLYQSIPEESKIDVNINISNRKEIIHLLLLRYPGADRLNSLCIYIIYTIRHII